MSDCRTAMHLTARFRVALHSCSSSVPMLYFFLT
jgi:hypothetical protein